MLIVVCLVAGIEPTLPVSLSDQLRVRQACEPP